MELYLGRVQNLLREVAADWSPGERMEAQHLIDHGEPAEALRTLAWIIVEEQKVVTRAQVDEIRELTQGLVEPEDMPAGLDECAIVPATRDGEAPGSDA